MFGCFNNFVYAVIPFHHKVEVNVIFPLGAATQCIGLHGG